MQNDLAQNLRTLCSYYRSISEVCQLANINRQQFNKYLGGQSTPSISTLRKINDFFGLQYDEVYLPKEEFKQLIDSRPRLTREPDKSPLDAFLTDALNNTRQSEQFLKPYTGLYHDYYCSPSNPQKILRSLISIYQEKGVTYTKSIERLPYQDRQKQRFFTVRYHGFVQVIEGRLVFTDLETRTLNNWGQRIYYPANRTRIDILCGLTMAISGGLEHQPFCAHAVLERLDESYPVKTALKQCSLYPLESPDIRDDIKEKLNIDAYSEKSFMISNS